MTSIILLELKYYCVSETLLIFSADIIIAYSFSVAEITFWSYYDSVLIKSRRICIYRLSTLSTLPLSLNYEKLYMVTSKSLQKQIHMKRPKTWIIETTKALITLPIVFKFYIIFFLNRALINKNGVSDSIKYYPSKICWISYRISFPLNKP